ncbi:MAG TPA: glutathione transferase GstA [Kofleriaceae bacterium]|jgi:glutathione S-transferase
MFKLYYAAGGCSIAPHIALREVGSSFELHTVNLKTKKLADGSDFLAVNPKGQIPALILDDGQLLTEGAVMLQYIADLDPSHNLAPRPGTIERVRLQEWLNFIATELHKGIAPLFRDEAAPEYKTLLKQRASQRLEWLAEQKSDKPFLLGEFSVADGYMFYILRSWVRAFSFELPSPSLQTYYQALIARPSVKAALLAEGLQP